MPPDVETSSQLILVCYFHTSDFVQSLDFANRVAAEKCKISGVEGVAKVLKKFALVDTR